MKTITNYFNTNQLIACSLVLAIAFVGIAYEILKTI